jgi:hypothetical protein
LITVKWKFLVFRNHFMRWNISKIWNSYSVLRHGISFWMQNTWPRRDSELNSEWHSYVDCVIILKKGARWLSKLTRE